MKRVVITGIGIVSPVGCGEGNAVWRRLAAGANGIQRLNPEQVPTGCNVTVAGLVPRGKEEGSFDEAEFKSMDRETSLFIKYALKASDYALQNSGLKSLPAENFPYPRDRCGVSIGNGGIGSLFEICNTWDTLKTSYRKISPYFVPKILVNMASGHVSIRHGFQGPVHSVTTACAAGTHSIGDAFNFIRLGYADLMLAGGSDASIEPLALAGFSRMKALSSPPYSEGVDDVAASRPFDVSRNGFVMGEGAGVLVLEELSSALARNAPIIAEVCGYGLSGDAHHATTPPDDGDGAFRSMQCALRDAKLRTTDIDYVNAHATSTPIGDIAEITAIRRLFSPEPSSSSAHSPSPLYVSSTKGATGHLLGAAGAVESAFTALALQNHTLPPTLHLDHLDPAVEQAQQQDGGTSRRIEHVPNTALPQPHLRYAMKNSFGFGGTNASLVLGSYKPGTHSN